MSCSKDGEGAGRAVGKPLESLGGESEGPDKGSVEEGWQEPIPLAATQSHLAVESVSPLPLGSRCAGETGPVSRSCGPLRGSVHLPSGVSLSPSLLPLLLSASHLAAHYSTLTHLSLSLLPQPQPSLTFPPFQGSAYSLPPLQSLCPGVTFPCLSLPSAEQNVQGCQRAGPTFVPSVLSGVLSPGAHTS